ncbi:UDP-glucose--hexose-1-phosphate uridylyltransferase [Clostridium folliculivorans]|uniref:Galactose-1-phosphate uridylyltransferase n=1 Tax=Clostridium folliculivorans TaxID=2886038 RepID=A0A9W5Y690_9CLOT|nr:UDP-glucose--hexose-1-phosphate uridylyltransferase [Clostridium folliculivorans]GKU27355.1 galactose-1-phosphate uridylyltransferase [Clostridium folliculivorans]GKU32206.1 galactose-1-phosphate uridylyltransferase [Clostridium folliculivorans]
MDINISKEIERLLEYAINKELIDPLDKIYTRNRLMEVLQLKELGCIEAGEEFEELEPILDNILTWALDNDILKDSGFVSRNLFDTKIMGCLIGRPSEVIQKFYSLYDLDKKKATEFFYNLSIDSNYVRMDRIKKNLSWKVSTEYGDIDITINLSKPEKDPKEIAKAKSIPSSSYPKCLLCKENEGYEGTLNHPARQNHRIIPLELDKETWYLQYSPYIYYNEHCIVLKGKHEEMKVTESTFLRLLQFVEKFPHYFIGSNADLPIVGGSILTHDHFQGGNYEFAMAVAPIEKSYTIKGFEEISIGRVKWPMSVIRLQSNSIEKLMDFSDYVLTKWKSYSDDLVGVIAFTENVPHNTITPIARRRGDLFEIDLVLRNNRTSKEYPFGIFHPHEELHHIKKENIGLIEVMGLAVLPPRLKDELKELEGYLINKEKIQDIKEDSNIFKHKKWAEDIVCKYSKIDDANIDKIIKQEVGLKFIKVLEHAGVFKRDKEGLKAFDDFIMSL